MHESEFPFPARIKVHLLSEDNKTVLVLLLPGHWIKFRDTKITLWRTVKRPISFFPSYLPAFTSYVHRCASCHGPLLINLVTSHKSDGIWVAYGGPALGRRNRISLQQKDPEEISNPICSGHITCDLFWMFYNDEKWCLNLLNVNKIYILRNTCARKV